MTTNQLSLKQNLISDAFRSRIDAVLPNHLTSERMIAVALTAITRTPDLAKPDVDQATFFKSMMMLSEMGLEPDGTHAHLIPFFNSRRQCREVQLIVDYKGLVLLAGRAGFTVQARVVYEGDSFHYNGHEVITHVLHYLIGEDSGDILAFYCKIEGTNPNEVSTRYEMMSNDEVQKVRSKSRGSDSGPWRDHYIEMGKKTVFRRAAKWIPFEPHIGRSIQSDDDTPSFAKPKPMTVDSTSFKAMLTESHQAKDDASDTSPVTSDE